MSGPEVLGYTGVPLDAFYGQPQLYAGYDFDGIGETELDGAGRNEPVWPELLDTMTHYPLLLETSDMSTVFSDRPDLTILKEDNTVTPLKEVRTQLIRRRS